MRKTLIPVLIGAALLLASCGSDDTTTDADAATTAAATETTAAPAADTTAAPAETTTPTVETSAAPAQTCATGKTVTAEMLTIATGEPAFPPYVLNDKTPEDGQGLEAGVAMAVAREMGFAPDKVKWVRTAFDVAIAPGPKEFDFNLQQFTITDERKQAVDFSDGYYTAPQAVFGLADSPAAKAATVAELQALKLGVAAGTTSIDYIANTIKPTTEAQIFNDNAGAKTALESKQIDAIVSDLPTALYITAVEIEGTKVYGQIEGSGTDQFGMLLSKGNPLTACVNEALAKVKASGELDAIAVKWMKDFTEAPIIKAG